MFKVNNNNKKNTKTKDRECDRVKYCALLINQASFFRDYLCVTNCNTENRSNWKQFYTSLIMGSIFHLLPPSCKDRTIRKI